MNGQFINTSIHRLPYHEVKCISKKEMHYIMIMNNGSEEKNKVG